MSNLLKQFTVKNGRLRHLRGPLAGKPAGHQRPNGEIYVTFDGIKYKHHDLLFLYNEQLAGKDLESINTVLGDYQTVSGHKVRFYNSVDTAEPYVIHGAVRINGRWVACQWTEKGIAPQNEFNLEKK